MSGDLGPEPAVQAACQLSLEQDIQMTLVGQQAVIDGYLKKFKHQPDRLDVIDAPDILTMEDSPKDVFEKRARSSLAVALQLLAKEPNSAFVTAGNTGALILGAKHHLNKIEGIKKSAFATIYPTKKNQSGRNFALILDVGATTHCTPEELRQFAKMGSCYARILFDVAQPKVGLLNIGAEAHKGGKNLQDTYLKK